MRPMHPQPSPLRETPTTVRQSLATPPCVLPPIDWWQPWLAPYRHPHGVVADALVQSGQMRVPQALLHCACLGAAAGTIGQNRPAAPVFVDQAALPPAQSYESFIRRTGQVPTREHVHDFFNGLVWLRFPAAKARLNALQAEQLAQRGRQGARGPVRDACTVFDENGAVLLAPAPLWQALLARDWWRLFVTLRPAWQQAQCLVFGHALLEQLCAPRKPLCAHVLTLPLPAAPARDDGNGDWDTIDQALAKALTAPAMATKPLTPLPVLGVPGWWPANADVAFYRDASVFRPARQRLPGAERRP